MNNLITIPVSGIEYYQKYTQRDTYSVTPEYWAGWVLAYYQWYTAKNFEQISADGLIFDKILRMYYPLHEADLSKFVEVAQHSVNN